MWSTLHHQQRGQRSKCRTMLRYIEEILKRKTTPYSQKEMEETAEVVLVIRAALQARIMHESVMAHISGRDSRGGFRFGRVFFFFSAVTQKLHTRGHWQCHSTSHSSTWSVGTIPNKVGEQVKRQSCRLGGCDLSVSSPSPSPGNLSKTCTADGWTQMHPIDIAVNCGYNLNSTSDDVSKTHGGAGTRWARRESTVRNQLGVGETESEPPVFKTPK